MTGDNQNLLADVQVVLLRPRWARNLGSVARAMKNFGLEKLTLVDSKIGSWNDAYQMAVHADDVLDNAKTLELTEALAPATWIVGTTNNPPPGTHQMTPREVAEEAVARGAPTLLFGGEIHGLDPAELLRCHVVSSVPTASEQSSLNLAQAVCVYGAELFAALKFAAESDSSDAREKETEALRASTEMLQRLEVALQRFLQNSTWSKADRPKNAIAALMQPFYRAQLTEKEARAWLVALGKQLPRSE
ncbi:MAG TPA: rRNA methyltransferase [Myxococcales bacterium]|nr:rRNA methyltransferase [Myxococcales bacterium]